MTRVLITPVQFRDMKAEYCQILARAGLEVSFPQDQRHVKCAEALISELQGVDAVIASTEPYTADVFAKTNLRVVARTGVGYDSIDVEAATNNNVLVTITPGAVEFSVAETTIALIFAVYRDVIARDREVKTGNWQRQGRPRLAGKTLGIVGFGRIGRAVAALAQGVNLCVVAYDPYATAAEDAGSQVRLCDLDELLATSDIVSLHAPCTPQTKHLIRAETLAMMKPDAVLVNTGRGPLVNEADLYAAMSRGHLLAAALDVFAEEPTPIDNPLLALPNVLTMPHTAGLDHQSEIDMPRIAAQCVADLYAGQWPEHCIVNKQLKHAWTWGE